MVEAKNKLPENLIVFVEGLPGSGKTEIIAKLKELGHAVVPEIIDMQKLGGHHNQPDQTFFLLNDERKVKIAERSPSTVVVDRSPLSTLVFNLAKFYLDQSVDIQKIFGWYIKNFSEKFAIRSRYLFLFIDIQPKASLKNKNSLTREADPWRNPKMLRLMRNLYLALGKNSIKKFKVIDWEDGVDIVLSKIKTEIERNA